MNLKTTATVKRLGIIVLALLVVIGSMLVIYPFMTQNAKLATDISAAQATKDEAADKLSKMNNLKATNPQVKQLDDDISKKFPATADTPGFAAFVGTAAAKAGLGLENITDLTTTIPTLSSAGAPAAPAPSAAPTTPAKDAPKDNSSAPAPATGASNLAEMNVTINVMGPMDQLEKFVANLKDGPRNILISTYAIQQGGAATEGVTTTAIISGKTFIYRPITVPSSDSKPATPSTPSTPAEPSAPATAPTP